MHAWESIQKTVDYIETNIKKKFEIEELAKIAALSPFYFQRLFSRLVKRPVMEYIKYRRLALVCDVLANKDLRILDIALEFGFENHSGFCQEELLYSGKYLQNGHI